MGMVQADLQDYLSELEDLSKRTIMIPISVVMDKLTQILEEE
jgi:hypothetical protein